MPLARYEGAEIGYAVMVRGPEGGRRTYYHAGVTQGYRTLWLLAPDTGEALIVLSSNARAPIQAVMRKGEGGRGRGERGAGSE